MDFSCIIKKLMESGLTQSDIADAADCRQPTISDILHGRIKDPSSSIAFGLLRLAKKRNIHISDSILQ